jgi:hypothetical protein
MFRELIVLSVVEIDTEPLDTRVERRLRASGRTRLVPARAHRRQTWPHLDRVRCRDCSFKPIDTYGTPFHEKYLSCGTVRVHALR